MPAAHASGAQATALAHASNAHTNMAYALLQKQLELLQKVKDTVQL